MGNIYYTLAEYDTATDKYDQALKILQNQQDSPTLAATYLGLGNLDNAQGEYLKAIENYSKALTIHKNLSDGEGVARDELKLGSVYKVIGDYNKALQYYKSALELFKSQNNLLGQGEAFGGLGNTYLALGDSTKAIEYQQEYLRIARQLEDKEAIGDALNNLGNALRQSGNLKESEKNLRDAIQVWESIRLELGEDDAKKISIFEKQSRTYRLLQQVLIAQKKFESALEIAESGRARAFVELLSKRTHSNAKEQSTPPPLNITQIKQVAKNQNSTLVEYSIIYDDVLTGNQQKPKPSELYIWVVKPTGEVTFKNVDLKPTLQNDITIADLVDASRISIGVRGRGKMFEISSNIDPSLNLKTLHQLLIDTIAKQLPSDPKSHVTFIPQSELFLVPFAALQDGQGKYLIEKHTILTAPAIAVLNLTHQKRQQVSGKGALVVGNPVMPSVPPKIGEPPQQLDPLPGAEKEAIAIAPILNTQPLIGKNATKAAVMQQISTARIIHLATHGLLDDYTRSGVPGAIALAPDTSLSPNNQQGQQSDNGLLTASEILELKLNSELVVLSACDTAVGKITGDGVIGLSRSLITAGVPSVIVSLWSIPDAPTAELMTEFYQNLQTNPDKANALREAMLTTMKKHPQPVNWAAFTLIGEAK